MSQYSAADFARRTGIRAEDEALLASLPLFKGMAPPRLQSLLADASVRRYTRHTMLFMQGDPAERFYVVFDGWVKLFRETPDGQETVIAVFARGESFAEAASFAEGLFPVGAEVIEEARLLVVPASSFTQRLRENPQLAINMLGSMSQHLRGLVQQVEQRTVKSAAQRVSAFLLRLSAEDGAGVGISLPTDKALVAARLGMQPETLSRALAKLRTIGVETKDRRITISDVGALKRLAEGDGR